MKGDLSRNTFDRARHYSSVRLQQGRIVTDADWNEQADLTRYRAERQARDCIGPCGVPMAAAGYALVAETNALAVHAVNSNVVWIAAEDGVLLLTTDDGANWSTVDAHTSEHLRSMDEIGGIGWAVGDRGVVRRTTDQGASWVAQDAGTFNTLRGVSAFDADRAWAVGDGGIVVATVDGGAHWSLVQAGASRLHAIHFADQLHGIAVGNGGVIVTSKDGGQTWTTVTSGTTAHLRALAAFGSTQAWAAGQGGKIIRSIDAGATWLACNAPTSANLYAIAFRDNLEGWAAGAGGVLLRTIDGGVNWTLDYSGTTAALRSLSFIGSQPGWLIGDASTALRIGGGSPDAVQVVLPAVNLSIEPGRGYFNGILCELEARASYAHQPDVGAADRLPEGMYLLYIDAWQRHVSALQAPAIREVALGGTDTATRAKTIAQVRALPLAASSPSDWNCNSPLAAWNELVEAQGPLLAARAEPQLAAANICELAATAGYRRLENQLYRVEIHEGGANPSFKFSRENGSVAYAVLGLSMDSGQKKTTVRLGARGRDSNLDLAAHDRVELVDDDAESLNRTGTIFEYLQDGNDELEVILSGVPSRALGQIPSRHPILRRWDQKPETPGVNTLPVVEGSWIDLEDGVQVRFGPGGVYRPGDYWQIPARTITANVEWPLDEDGDPIALPPAGIVDSYCRLGIVEVAHNGVVTILSDCRNPFPPLTEMEQLLYVSGDGQDGVPGAELAQRLMVRVARGECPIAGARVRFEIDSGHGSLEGLPAGLPLESTTDSDGIASCRWALDPDYAAAARYQRVRAGLLDSTGTAKPGEVVVFCATATIVLAQLAGDGQAAAAGQPLAHPLEVGAANGQTSIANVPVHFVAQGGGQLVGANPALTGTDGIASISWQLGNAGPQRVEAQLHDAGGTTIQKVAFNADIEAQAGPGGGCAVTVGKGGEIDQLTTDALKKLLDQFNGRVCMCFLPGDHVIENLAPPVDFLHNFSVSIHGCGRTSVITLSGALSFSGFHSIDLADLAIVAKQGSGIAFSGCDEVRVSGLQIDGPPSPELPLLRFANTASVTVQGCRIRTKLPGLSIVFDDAVAKIQFAGNEVQGVLSFYGIPAVPTPPINFGGVAGRFANNAPVQATNGLLFMRGNSVELLTIGRQKIAEINAFASAPAPVPLTGLFNTTTLEGNTFAASGNAFASRFLSIGSCVWLGPSQPLGTLVAEGAATVGNVGTANSDALELIVVAKKALSAQAGNAVFVLNP